MWALLFCLLVIVAWIIIPLSQWRAFREWQGGRWVFDEELNKWRQLASNEAYYSKDDYWSLDKQRTEDKNESKADQ